MSATKPIILIGTHRSGTTWLGKVLSTHSKLAYWIEPRYVWSWRNNYKPDDVLTEFDVTPTITNHIRQRFDKFIKKQGKERLLEKTPSNCLRLSFIRAVYPEAKILHIIRDGRSVFNSVNQILNSGYYRQEVLSRRLLEMFLETPTWELPAQIPRITETLKSKLMGLPLTFWGPRPQGWREWVKQDSPNVILAKQWAAIINQSIRDSALIDSNFYYRFYYEDLINKPRETMSNIVEFAEIDDTDKLIDYIKNTVNSGNQSKWRKILDKETLEEIQPYMESTLNKLGYKW
ncbi:MAG: sulfotransferase [Cyanobacteria bacterium J06621_15]